MRFVIKAVFWFTIVVLFLPDNGVNRAENREDRSAGIPAISAAAEIRDLATKIQNLCSENPAVCESGLEKADVITRFLRAEAGFEGSAAANAGD